MYVIVTLEVLALNANNSLKCDKIWFQILKMYICNNHNYYVLLYVQL